MPQYQKLMKTFWNAKAAEDAAFYVDTRRDYKVQDLSHFYISAQAAQDFLTAANYTPGPRDRMLEIGCGIGRVTAGFAPLFACIEAVDVSEMMIAKARENLKHLTNVHFASNDGVGLVDFEDNVFDFCFSCIVFQHIPDKQITFGYIREVGRVLKPQGVFRFQVNGLPDVDTGVHPAIRLAKRLYRRYVKSPLKTTFGLMQGKPRGFDSAAWTGSHLSAPEVRRVIQESGMRVTGMEGEGIAYMWVTCQKVAT